MSTVLSTPMLKLAVILVILVCLLLYSMWHPCLHSDAAFDIGPTEESSHLCIGESLLGLHANSRPLSLDVNSLDARPRCSLLLQLTISGFLFL